MPNKIVKAVLLLAVMFITAAEASAQIKDPTTWTYEAKRKFGNHFEVFFHLKLEPKWHIFALNPGGDGSSIAPSFTFDKNSKVKVLGKMKETSKPIEERMEGVEGITRSFKDEVTFVQEVEVTGNTPVKLTGKHEYQVCNDMMCLPPKSKTFTVSIKP